MPFRYEYKEKLRVACIGAGALAYTGILPALSYAPVELMALADSDQERGLDAARSFGARRFYPNHKALLNKEEELDAVFVLSEPDEDGLPTQPAVAALALEAGLHAWVASPPCSSPDEISVYTSACLKKQRYAVAGFVKSLSPVYVKLKETLEAAAFGELTSFAMHYSLAVPSSQALVRPRGRARFLSFLDPYALLIHLFGEAKEACLLRSGDSLDATVQLRYPSGLAGHIHLSPAVSAERLQVFGTGGSLTAKGGTTLELWQPGETMPTGQRILLQEKSFGARERRTVWRQDLTEPRLAYTPAFSQGWVASVRHFAARLLAGEAPRLGNLVEILHAITLFDKLCHAESGTWFTI